MIYGQKCAQLHCVYFRRSNNWSSAVFGKCNLLPSVFETISMIPKDCPYKDELKVYEVRQKLKNQIF